MSTFAILALLNPDFLDFISEIQIMSSESLNSNQHFLKNFFCLRSQDMMGIVYVTEIDKSHDIMRLSHDVRACMQS